MYCITFGRLCGAYSKIYTYKYETKLTSNGAEASLTSL